MAVLEILVAREKDVAAQIETLARERADLRRQIANLRSPFNVGDRVTFEGDNRVWQLSKIYPGYGGDPKYAGYLIKKNGEPGAVEREIYMFGNKKLIAATPTGEGIAAPASNEGAKP